MTYGNLNAYREVALGGTGDHTITHLHKQDGPVLMDSIEVGTPGKGGAVKVYFNSSDVADAKARIMNAMEVRKFAREQVEQAG